MRYAQPFVYFLLSTCVFFLQLGTIFLARDFTRQIELLEYGLTTVVTASFTILLGLASGIILALMMVYPKTDFGDQKREMFIKVTLLSVFPLLGVLLKILISAFGPGIFPFSFINPGLLEFVEWTMQSQVPSLWLGLVIGWLIKQRVLLAGVFSLGLFLGGILLTTPSRFPTETPAETSPQEPLLEEPVPVAVGGKAIYIEYTFEETMAQADAIFIGEVTAISSPRWNQDSGEYWAYEEGGNPPMQLSQLDVVIRQALVDTLGLGEKVTITVLGENAVQLEDYTIDSSTGSPHALEIGNQGVFFVISTQFPWRDGKRPVIGFLGYPPDSYLLAGRDDLYYSQLVPEGISLDDLVKQINETRQ